MKFSDLESGQAFFLRDHYNESVRSLVVFKKVGDKEAVILLDEKVQETKFPVNLSTRVCLLPGINQTPVTDS